MLHRNERHVDTRQRAHVTGPLAGTVNDDLGLNRTVRGIHTAHATLLNADAFDLHVLKYLHAVVFCSFCQGAPNIRRIRLTIRG